MVAEGFKVKKIFHVRYRHFLELHILLPSEKQFNCQFKRKVKESVANFGILKIKVVLYPGFIDFYFKLPAQNFVYCVSSMFSAGGQMGFMDGQNFLNLTS